MPTCLHRELFKCHCVWWTPPTTTEIRVIWHLKVNPTDNDLCLLYPHPAPHTLPVLSCLFPLIPVSGSNMLNCEMLKKGNSFLAYLSHVAIIPWITVSVVNAASKAVNLVDFFFSAELYNCYFHLNYPKWVGSHFEIWPRNKLTGKETHSRASFLRRSVTSLQKEKYTLVSSPTWLCTPSKGAWHSVNR